MPFWRSVHHAKVPFWRSVHRAKVPFSDGTLPFWKPGQNTDTVWGYRHLASFASPCMDVSRVTWRLMIGLCVPRDCYSMLSPANKGSKSPGAPSPKKGMKKEEDWKEVIRKWVHHISCWSSSLGALNISFLAIVCLGTYSLQLQYLWTWPIICRLTNHL